MACIFASLLCFPSPYLNIALEGQCEGANFKAKYSVHRETDQLPGMIGVNYKKPTGEVLPIYSGRISGDNLERTTGLPLLFILSV